ncbi:hypothetical protein EDF56_104303 [Novosphingobium sp. PhB165]|uniref:RBBP9/YdeN family alpha/beta hydrolase n=1 Tax=Novosphingobium sp. PhB165 TaxID=2485105 RepID=UPI0010487787|nr:alpha/beta hydrolase [Novosphingobium sp. PhB165]TCM18770.1 hypothetical protein EDF56_104303 [Novosphingobium sp. PhB165]
MSTYVVLPGIGGSGSAHWQTLWEQSDPAMSRFAPSSWDEPELDDWIAALDRAVAAAEEPPILIAHSLACLLVAHWSARSALPVRGALLVAVPDPDGSAFPAEARGFAEPPTSPLRFPALIVASTDDPYGPIGHARLRSRQWECPLIEAGALSHINGASGLGDWSWGRAQLDGFVQSLPVTQI